MGANSKSPERVWSLVSKLPPWPRYENDASFRHWIDMSELAPDYTFAWFVDSFRQSKLSVA